MSIIDTVNELDAERLVDEPSYFTERLRRVFTDYNHTYS